ncbi:uncharacterized protein MYCGRDRAFT_97749 [Zymoseptoria tritici IPO323]|uniref:Uncharacterized protein n=1 Tax=Zymoseptoria tritici (strain CBS 115943 / IPO323) TaxID=336722 RepID=F9XR90_ZYMTI|nr:uncharacterized protein MYCGRDRAFT_97749 [Zymoseptoria tritici IPO323]EGP82217.1 hypothetical protein MYCGRDRAFT_97749 [Zymoseptoria tritici IPO323]
MKPTWPRRSAAWRRAKTAQAEANWNLWNESGKYCQLGSIWSLQDAGSGHWRPDGYTTRAHAYPLLPPKLNHTTQGGYQVIRGLKDQRLPSRHEKLRPDAPTEPPSHCNMDVRRSRSSSGPLRTHDPATRNQALEARVSRPKMAAAKSGAESMLRTPAVDQSRTGRLSEEQSTTACEESKSTCATCQHVLCKCRSYGPGLVRSSPEPDDEDLCLCFPCILSYLGRYIEASSERQCYPELQAKGFSQEQQLAIAEEWYWISVERHTAIQDYLHGVGILGDGCAWRPPPVSALTMRPRSPPASLSTMRSGVGVVVEQNGLPKKSGCK